MRLDKAWTVTLADGRTVTVGSGIDEDRGVWILHPAPLLRWLTSEDAGKIADALRAAGEYLAAHPIKPRKRTARKPRKAGT